MGVRDRRTPPRDRGKTLARGVSTGARVGVQQLRRGLKTRQRGPDEGSALSAGARVDVQQLGGSLKIVTGLNGGHAVNFPRFQNT